VQLATLPDKISYSIVTLTSPLNHTTRLPRRELFDVRLQLMAEDDNSNPNLLSGLDDSDLRTNIYEGGYKTWECSLDLCRYLLDRGPRKDIDDMSRVDHVIEMGCGSALPSLLLFQYARRNNLGLYFTLTDYNEDVLRLVTVPNLLLTWVAGLDDTQSHELFPESGNPLKTEEENGELYLTPQILESFKSHLTKQGIVLTIISGSWTPTQSFISLVPNAPDLNTFILGSETIYSPTSCTAFTDAITALMRRTKMAKALVAAKRVYFGVGGSVDGFRMEVAEKGGVAGEVEFEGLDGDGEGGVRRCLVEVQMV
jgi:protein-histidine N-methyltransferase